MNSNQIQYKKNEMQIGTKGIENIFVTMVLKKNPPLKRHKSKKTPFHPS
jgi:hypothetical protein